jgi:hypothetical protein
MSERQSLPWPCRAALAACVGSALLACAGPAPETKQPAAAAAPAAEAPPSPERERFERWKQAQPAADPRPDFARQAEAEAERRRREALEAGASLAPEGAEPESSGE